MSGNKAYLHVNTATAGAIISRNPGAIFGGITINTPASAATSSVLTIYDGQSTAGRVIAAINVQNTNIPGAEYNVVAPSGLFYTYVQTGAVTTVGDFTIEYL